MVAMLAESRVARVAMVIAALLLPLSIVLSRGGARRLLTADEQVRAFAAAAAWEAAARTVRCPRPALREPTTGDGSLLLAKLLVESSPEARCLHRISGLYEELREPRKLAALAPHPEVVEACAALYDDIERVAHATEACSPMHAPAFDVLGPDSFVPLLHVDPVVRFRIAPMVAHGELGTAARHVLDAMRFADDLGRKTHFLGAMISSGTALKLADTLGELLDDPRLTADDARAIARDLDVVLASAPSFSDAVHGEIAEVPHMIEHIDDITGDPTQDRALILLGGARWLDEFDRVCTSASLRLCAERIRPVLPVDYDFARTLEANPDDDAARDRLIEQFAAEHRILGIDARRFAEHDFVLTALRMQAEVRIAGNCRDAHLERWLADELTLDGDTLKPPAWLRAGEHPMPPRTLRCGR